MTEPTREELTRRMRRLLGSNLDVGATFEARVDELLRSHDDLRTYYDAALRGLDAGDQLYLRACAANTTITTQLNELQGRVAEAQRACADAVEHATTPEATQLLTRVLALLSDPGIVHEVEVDDDGQAGDCIDDCVGCAAERGEPPTPFVPVDQAFPEEQP